MAPSRFAFAALLCMIAASVSAQEAFPKTEVGVSEFKQTPAGLRIRSEGKGRYFDQDNSLFMPLFRYLQSHSLSMTTPVEARIEPAAMYFWVQESERSRAASPDGAVSPEETAPRTVASRGARGAYSESNFNKTRDELLEWLKGHPEAQPTGAAYAVFWNGPFVPWFAKRYEVHIPVRLGKPAAEKGR